MKSIRSKFPSAFGFWLSVLRKRSREGHEERHLKEDGLEKRQRYWKNERGRGIDRGSEREREKKNNREREREIIG